MILFQFHYPTHRILCFHFISLYTTAFHLNEIIILFPVLRSQQLKEVRVGLNGMGSCMYVIQYVNSGAALSGTYTATGRISELCNNGDFILSLATWCHHSLISSANGHYWVFGLHNTCLARNVQYICARLDHRWCVEEVDNPWWCMCVHTMCVFE